MELIIKEFIVEKLRMLSNMFPNMTFKLAKSEYSGDYFVEVSPIHEYNSEKYMLAESNVLYEFLQSCPEDNLTFISSNSSIQFNIHIAIVSSLIPYGLELDKNFKFRDVFSTYSVNNLHAGEESYAMAA